MFSASLQMDRNTSSADIRGLGHLIKKTQTQRLYISFPFVSSGWASREQDVLVISIKTASLHRSPGPGPCTARAEQLREAFADSTKPVSACLQ